MCYFLERYLHLKYRYIQFKIQISIINIRVKISAIQLEISVFLIQTSVFMENTYISYLNRIFEMQISLFMNLIIFNFHFQQIINTPMLKAFDRVTLAQVVN